MNRGVSSWQSHLLPFMSMMLVGLTLFFLGATIFQLYALQREVTNAPRLEEVDEQAIREAFSESAEPQAQVGALMYTLARLEAHVLTLRYHMAEVMLMARLWTRYLGFVTGMILALVGATFILGKLREASSSVNVDAAFGKLAVVSTSPGLVLAVLGTALMLATILTNPDMKVVDSAVYLKEPKLSAAAGPQVSVQPDPRRPTEDTGTSIVDDIRRSVQQ